MTMSKHDLIERFLAGRVQGEASREMLSVIGNTRCIIGYGWAVYAAELPDGTYALFGDGYATRGDNVGWAGYSGQTTQHLQEIKGMFEERGEPYVVVDAQLRAKPPWVISTDRPILSDMTQDELADFVDENEVEPAEGTGYTMTLTR